MSEKKKAKAPLKINRVKVLIFTLLMLTLIMILIILTKSFLQNKENNPDNKYVQIQEDGTKVNTSKKLAETKTIDGVEIKNITLKEKNNITVLEATATNTNKEVKEGFMIDIEFVDDKNQPITKIIEYISKLQAGETTTITTQTTLDFANSYNINITKSEE